MVIHDTAEKLKKTREDSAPLSTLKERYAKKQKLMMNKTWEQLGARSGCPAGAAAAPAGGPLRSAPSHRFPVPTPRLGHRCRRFRLQQVRLPRPGSQRPSSLAVGAPAEHARPGGSEHGRALTWGGVRGGALRGAHARPRRLPAPRAADGGGARREKRREKGREKGPRGSRVRTAARGEARDPVSSEACAGSVAARDTREGAGNEVGK